LCLLDVLVKEVKVGEVLPYLVDVDINEHSRYLRSLFWADKLGNKVVDRFADSLLVNWVLRNDCRKDWDGLAVELVAQLMVRFFDMN
jgi:hypothetical protein